MKISHRLFAVALGLGVLGMMTSADALAQAKMKKSKLQDLVLKGDAKCTACHDEEDAPKVLYIGRTKHGTLADGRTPGCTKCHGDSAKHIADAEAGEKKPAQPDVAFGRDSKTEMHTRNESCLACHQGGNRTHWESSTHASRDTGCTSCHRIHATQDPVRDKFGGQSEVCFTCHKEQRAMINRPVHHPIREGKMNCSDCHNVHGGNPKQLARSSVNEVCYTCHMEKRGPFLHNHQPVTEDCSICHQPHGTVIASLLKQRPPYLCQECHSHTSHPGQVAGIPTGPSTSTSFMGTIARGCVNCHTNIHGGNSTVDRATAGRFRR
jgi:DmsE family decaheme c-type cytochrome